MKNVTPITERKQYPLDLRHGTAPTEEMERDRRRRIAETKHKQLLARRNRGLVLVDQINQAVAEPDEEDTPRRRPKFHELRPHQEKAAIQIAAGRTIADAAAEAAVSPRQVRKYLTDPNFRDRIIELRQIVMSEMQGKIMEELRARVAPEKIAKMEVMDLLRIYDRTVGGKDKGLEDSTTVQKYDQIFNTLILSAQPSGNPNSKSESEDFQEYGPEDLLLPGGDSQSD